MASYAKVFPLFLFLRLLLLVVDVVVGCAHAVPPVFAGALPAGLPLLDLAVDGAHLVRQALGMVQTQRLLRAHALLLVQIALA